MRQVGDVGIEGLLVGMVHVAEVVQEEVGFAGASNCYMKP